jgi:alpha-beta hydrolase superfamily lysophospholipase
MLRGGADSFGRGVLSAAAVIDRTLTQVIRYQRDSEIHGRAIARVNEHLVSDTRVVIGHSLGSVVAYDALRARPAEQPLPVLVTLGSPLGLSAIRTRLLPQPPAYPATVRRLGQYRRT